MAWQAFARPLAAKRRHLDPLPRVDLFKLCFNRKISPNRTPQTAV